MRKPQNDSTETVKRPANPVDYQKPKLSQFGNMTQLTRMMASPAKGK